MKTIVSVHLIGMEKSSSLLSAAHDSPPSSPGGLPLFRLEGVHFSISIKWTHSRKDTPIVL